MNAIAPEAIFAELLELDPEVQLERYYGERSLFYNPRRQAPLGVIFASIKEDDGPNDQASQLSRHGVYRLAFQLTPDEYATRFGPAPARPPRGGFVSLDFDLVALGELTPHPVYAWMRWAQILSPRVDSSASCAPCSMNRLRSPWPSGRADRGASRRRTRFRRVPKEMGVQPGPDGRVRCWWCLGALEYTTTTTGSGDVRCTARSSCSRC